MISREWSKRRITVQCNVRGRDMGSFIAEAQQRIAGEVSLPHGYAIEWGGQFENMQRAQQRLMIVVPLALALIVVLLYVTYRNLTDTLCVFASVPLACVGGIALLWVRDMPISISAAVGFITLSGVSVLNSMVFVSAFRDLLREGLAPVGGDRRRRRSTRLRTVMMTALVASVGFAPMALSTGMGAEVQRPLATVVIGGVISSTLHDAVRHADPLSALRASEAGAGHAAASAGHWLARASRRCAAVISCRRQPGPTAGRRNRGTAASRSRSVREARVAGDSQSCHPPTSQPAAVR